MAWFAAHEIEYFKYREREQDVFPVWENIHLIEAENVDDAWEKARKLVKEQETDDETLTVENIPSKCISAGIRKIVEVSHWEEKGVLKHGDEITHNEFNVFDEKGIQKILDGENINVEVIE